MGESLDRPWGKINRRQPYVVITRDLLRVFFHARMNVAERAIFGYMLEHSWGDATRGKKGGSPWPEALPCDLNLYSLACTCKIDYSYLRKALRSLVADRVLLRSGDTYLINKDADQWAESRITRECLEHAAGAIRTGNPAESHADPLGGAQPPNCVHLGGAQPPSRGRTATYLGGAAPPNTTVLGGAQPPIVSSHIGTHAELDSERVKRERRAPPPGDGLGLEPFESAPDAHPLPIPAEADPKTAAALDRALDVAKEVWPHASPLHRSIINRQGGYAADWYLPAVVILSRKKKDQQTLSYFMGILHSFKRQGGPDDLTPLGPAVTLKPSQINTPEYLVPEDRPVVTHAPKGRPAR